MDVPPRWESYTWYVDIRWVRLEFTVTRDPLPTLDVWIKTVKKISYTKVTYFFWNKNYICLVKIYTV